MSGIFGLVDPDGVDSALFASAADQVSYRGRPALYSVGCVSLGTFIWDGEQPEVLDRPDALLVADARVDAAIAGTPASKLDADGLELLDMVLDQAGPDGLEGIAAEFALARYDRRQEQLLLARDHIGVRPMYWARRGSRFGFACDASLLVAFGLATGELDDEAIVRSLALGSPDDLASGFRGISRVRSGGCLRVNVGGSVSERRWFFPERVPRSIRDLDQAGEMTRAAVLAAVADRARGQRVSLLQSSGRDSGSVAIALNQLGVSATCLTFRFDAPRAQSELPAARNLAEAMGHTWEEVFVPARGTPSDLNELARVNRGPLGIQFFPIMFAIRGAVERAGSTIVLDGNGGEPLFTAPPFVVLDLLRTGDIATAARAVRGFQRDWGTGFATSIKEILRGITPSPFVRLRERTRRRPPWLASVPEEALQPDRRTARDYVVRTLLAAGGENESFDRMLQPLRVRYSSPLFDMRVVRVALRLPVQYLLPVTQPKPVLAKAFLGPWASSRAKVPFTPYFEALADALLRDFPSLAGEGSLCAQRGYIRGSCVRASDLDEWKTALLAVVPVEAWLRGGTVDRYEVGVRTTSR